MLTNGNLRVYDLKKIKRGFLLYAKHKTWTEGKAGIITSVSETSITVQYFPGIGNVTNHFFLPVSEVECGDWLIRWSEDLLTVETGGENDES